jgi:hypothetical protein
MKLRHNGKTRNLEQWCESLELNPDLVKARLHAGWSVAQALGRRNDYFRFIDRQEHEAPEPPPAPPQSPMERELHDFGIYLDAEQLERYRAWVSNQLSRHHENA